MAGREPAGELWVEANRPERHAGVACPICRGATAEVPLPVDDGHVHLDVCVGCQFVWFDPQELERLPEAPAVPGQQEPLAQEVREKITIAEAESVGKRAEREDGTFTGPAEKWKWIPGLLGMPVECGVAGVKCWPWVTWGLAATLVVVFGVTYQNLEDVVGQYGLIPAEAWRDGGLTLLSSFFLHAGLLHLIANAYFLLVFGDNVEEYLGCWRYVFLLVTAALVGNAAHILGDARSTMPCIGASGGISGVITFYALRFPEARLGILLRYWLAFGWLYMPAYVALILWFVLQFLMAFTQLAGMSNVSALAHLGGAAVGVVAWIVWRQK